MTPVPLWRNPQPLVLASGSKTRRDMLLAAGLPIQVDLPDIDERSLETALPETTTAAERASALARAKALDVARRHPGRLVLGADQILEWDSRVIHKPVDLVAARCQLAAMAATAHHLHAAFALVRDGSILSAGVSTATLVMRTLDEAMLDGYLAAAGSAILTSVGGYQLEKLGAHLFSSITGDHFTILGLPLLRVLAALRDEGALT